MPQSKPTPKPEASPAPAAATEAPPRSMLAKVKVLAFIAVVIAIECVVAYFCLPGAADTAAMAEAVLREGAASSAASAVPEGAAGKTPENEWTTAVDQIEVDLGEFSITAFQPVSNSTLRIDFRLYGTVAAADQKEFLKRMEGNLHRFREQVIVIVRSAELTDLTDAGLGLLKRRIQERTNQMLGKPLLRVVIFSDFSFIEQ